MNIELIQNHNIIPNCIYPDYIIRLLDYILYFVYK